MIDWTRVRVLQNEVGADDFDEIVELFLEEVEGAINQLRSGSALDTLGETLHFLKGSALSLGFATFSGLCHHGEVEAEQGNNSAVDIDHLHRSYTASKAAFLAGLPNLKAA